MWNLANVEYSIPEEYKFQTENPYFDEENLEQKARIFIQTMKMKEAILALEAGLTKYEDNIEMWKTLGILHQEGDNDEKAICCFKKACSIEENNLEVLTNLSISYINNLDISECLRTIKRWLLANPSYSSVVEEYPKEKITEDSATLSDALGKAYQVDPRDTQLLSLLGVLCFVESNFSKAADYFKQAVLVNPNNYGFWNKLGASYANSSDQEKSKICYNVALSIRPNLVRAWTNLGVAYISDSNSEQAIVPLLNALSFNTEVNHIWSYLTMVFMNLGRDEERVAAIQKDFEYFKSKYNVIDPNNMPLPSFDKVEESLQLIKDGS